MEPEVLEITPQELAQEMRERRGLLQLSQEGLAVYASDPRVTQENVSRWEKGEGLCEHVAFLKVLDVLGLELVRRPFMRYRITPESDESEPA